VEQREQVGQPLVRGVGPRWPAVIPAARRGPSTVSRYGPARLPSEKAPRPGTGGAAGFGSGSIFAGYAAFPQCFQAGTPACLRITLTAATSAA
jgi:hypothetical protein